VRRIPASPRPDWQSKVTAAGLSWHTPAEPYWNESTFYEFTPKEIDTLEFATNQLAEMTLVAAQHIIDRKLYAQLGIPEIAIPLIQNSWEQDVPSLYGRFDLTYDGANPPKLFEYNADTPTSLLEAAVIQWYWLEDTHPDCDQFNSIHERLIAQWRELAPSFPDSRIDFFSADEEEDRTTVTYLLDTAQQAGLTGTTFLAEQIGWNDTHFLAPDGRPLTSAFKLYPWEWLLHEEFGKHLGESKTLWVEPAWKMLLSNKGLLPVLWELYPDHPNLLAAGWTEPRTGSWVKKPLLSREGANITLHDQGRELSTGGDYGEEGFVYQDLAPLTSFDGKYPVIGSWVIGHEPHDAAAGIGIRESDIAITTNLSQFVPHLFA
jgi:glutathionylspermidine synthase